MTYGGAHGYTGEENDDGYGYRRDDGYGDDGDGRPQRRPLPAGAKLTAGVLLLVPLVALALVPTYSHTTPVLWGFPFFYWYQLAWVILTPAFTWGAYLVVTRARGERR